MRSLLIDVENAEVKEIEINDYRDFEKLINCSAIDVARRYIGNENRCYDIIVDDCGMLKENAIVSAINLTEVMLVGNLVVTKTGADGEQIPLADDDINYLYEYIRTLYKPTEKGFEKSPVLVDVKYWKEWW